MSTKSQKQMNIPGQTVASSISDVPVTVQRRPFQQPEGEQTLSHTGTPRANIAATYDHPNGTTEYDWAKLHGHQTVLQQHCEFFDTDRDGVIWPLDTFRGFYKLGFGVILSVLSMFIIHSSFAYPTLSGYLPDPMFRLYLDNVHKDKHGSDSGTYDTEGRFDPQKFEDMFSKYAGGKNHMTFWDIMALLKGNRLVFDPFGWAGAVFEWGSLYIMLWPADGRMMKEDVRGLYDGSLFYKVASRRAAKDEVGGKEY